MVQWWQLTHCCFTAIGHQRAIKRGLLLFWGILKWSHPSSFTDRGLSPHFPGQPARPSKFGQWSKLMRSIVENYVLCCCNPSSRLLYLQMQRMFRRDGCIFFSLPWLVMSQFFWVWAACFILQATLWFYQFWASQDVSEKAGTLI